VFGGDCGGGGERGGGGGGGGVCQVVLVRSRCALVCDLCAGGVWCEGVCLAAGCRGGGVWGLWVWCFVFPCLGVPFSGAAFPKEAPSFQNFGHPLTGLVIRDRG